MSSTRNNETLGTMDAEYLEKLVSESINSQSHERLRFREDLEKEFVDYNTHKMRTNLQEHGVKLIAIFLALTAMLFVAVPFHALGDYPWIIALLFVGLLIRYIDSHISSVDPYTELFSTLGGATAIGLVLYGLTGIAEGYVKQIAMIGVALMLIAYYAFFKLRLKRALVGSLSVGIMFVVYARLTDYDLKWVLFSSYFIAPTLMGVGICYIAEYRERLVFLQELSLKLESKKLEKLYEEVKQLSLIDPLTNLYNRRHLTEVLNHEWARSSRSAHSLAMIFCDIDYFKQYNDYYGHHAGDEALQKIARSLQQCANRSTDIVSRYGGEEFVLVFPETNSTQMFALLERIQKQVTALSIPHQQSPYKIVTISIGAHVCIPDPDECYEEALKKADTALYVAKTKGRNCWAFYEEAYSQHS